MKKFIIFVIMIFSAFTILSYCKGKDFSIYNYLKQFENMESIKMPDLPEYDFKSLTDIMQFKKHYEIDYQEIKKDFNVYIDEYGEFFSENSYYIIIDNNKYEVAYTEYNQNGAGESVPYIYNKKYTVDEYNLLPDSLKNYCSYISDENLEGIEYFTYYVQKFFTWFIQPIQFIVSFFGFFFEWFIYIFKIITLLGGELVL